MVTANFIQNYKEALGRIRDDLSDTNLRGCLNNSTDLTRMADFVGFDEGVLIGEILEGIFDNFEDMINLFEYKPEEIEPIKKELMALISVIEEKIPSKSERAKAKLYATLVSARCCVTHLQIQFFREKRPKKPSMPPLLEPE
jgi:hypothetical protein